MKCAGHCPQRQAARPETDETKSSAGLRVVGLPDALCQLLRQHRSQQHRERLRAGQLWADGDWLFATETGEPLNPRTDWDEWKRLLRARWHPRRPAPRRAAHRCDGAPAARRERAHDDGRDGLVQPGHGPPLRPHGRPRAARHRPTARRTPVVRDTRRRSPRCRDTRGRRGAEMRLELRRDAKTPTPPRRVGPAFPLVSAAVAVGFEPTEGRPSHVFETCSFGRSDTPPRLRVLDVAEGQKSRRETDRTRFRVRICCDIVGPYLRS
jgi:hypothetical protein